MRGGGAERRESARESDRESDREKRERTWLPTRWNDMVIVELTGPRIRGFIRSTSHPSTYRGTSLIRNSPQLLCTNMDPN